MEERRSLGSIRDLWPLGGRTIALASFGKKTNLAGDLQRVKNVTSAYVEGQTEESFVNEVLAAYLLSRGYEGVAARIIGNARFRRQRGGIRPWPTVKKEIINHLKEDAGCIATTMVDYTVCHNRGLVLGLGDLKQLALRSLIRGLMYKPHSSRRWRRRSTNPSVSFLSC